MNNQNSSVIKLKRALKNKNTVTVICVMLIVVILLVGYQTRINGATKPIAVCYAKEEIQPRQQITDDKIGTKQIASAAVENTVYRNCNEVRNQYANYNTIIPKGSMFYNGTVIPAADLPDAALRDIPNGYTLYSMQVDMNSTYMNSLLPDNYIDIYVLTKDPGGKAVVGKFLSNVKIRAVRDANGLNVFENSSERRIPSRLFIAVPDEQFLLLKRVETINQNGIGSRITLTPVPIAVITEGDSSLTPTVSSKYLEEYVTALSKEVPTEHEVEE